MVLYFNDHALLIDALGQVWMKLAKWFRKISRKCKKLRETDGQTPEKRDQKS